MAHSPNTIILPASLAEDPRYNFVYTPTYNGRPPEDYDPDKWFGPNYLQRILEGPDRNE